MKIQRLLIVANLGSIKAYRIDVPPGRAPFPHVLENLELEEAHEREQEISDASGHFHAKASQGIVSESGERLGLEMEIHHRLLRKVTKTVELFLDKYQPQEWLFAAPSEINDTILQGVTSTWSKRRGENVAQNLSNAPLLELASHFKRISLQSSRSDNV